MENSVGSGNVLHGRSTYLVNIIQGLPPGHKLLHSKALEIDTEMQFWSFVFTGEGNVNVPEVLKLRMSYEVGKSGG